MFSFLLWHNIHAVMCSNLLDIVWNERVLRKILSWLAYYNKGILRYWVFLWQRIVWRLGTDRIVSYRKWFLKKIWPGNRMEEACWVRNILWYRWPRDLEQVYLLLNTNLLPILCHAIISFRYSQAKVLGATQ